MAFEDNQQLATIFEEIADFLEMQGENLFKVKAYQKAARALETLDRPVADLHSSGELASTPGFGKALVEKVGQYFETGQVDLHTRLRDSFPPKILELIRVPSLGAKKAAILHNELAVGSIEDLERVIAEGHVRTLKGFGKRSEEKLLEGIAQLRQGEERWTLARASRLANLLLEKLRELPEVGRVEAAGSLRRAKETIGDLDLVVTTAQPQVVMDTFASWVQPAHIVVKGPTKTSIRWEGTIQVDLRCVEADSFGAAMQYFTGSKDHNVMLRGRAEKMSLKLNEYGLFDALGNNLASRTEEEIYTTLKLPYFLPELREGDGVPTVTPVNEDQVLGNLHTHSLWSDGSDTLEQLADEARKRGYRFLAITDHSRSMIVANGLTVERLLEQGEAIKQLNAQFSDGFRLLWGTECDILGDGSLDFPDEILEKLDFVIAAVHSQFQQPEDVMTARIIKAVSHPLVRTLAHPTGRVLGRRAGYKADWEAIFRAAAAHSTAMEMNCSAHRLDLPDNLARRALELGCNISLGTDAHSLPEFDNLPLGVKQARRAGVTADRLLNTRC